ncbi:uncharacterized protein ACNS7B_017503 [Menidia menidia]
MEISLKSVFGFNHKTSPVYNLASESYRCKGMWSSPLQGTSFSVSPPLLEVSSGQLYELRRALADSVAPGLHTLTGYVKTSITSHYPLITRIDQALTEVSTYANSTRPGPYKRRPLRRGQKPQHSSPLLTFVGFTDPENMVKYFSVDWLAQSHRGDRGAGADPAPTCRPHVACMVQPSAPTFGKSYLQPKPKPSRPAPERAEPFASPHPQNCPSPISETSGYSSGYESEVASSECFSVDEGTEAERDGAQRRVRTKFSPEQISKLEKIFSKHKYLDSGERVKTAQKLNLTETQVRTWFQNRRMKLKREVQDYLAPQLPAVAFRPLPRVHYHPVAGHQLLLRPQHMPLPHGPHLVIHHPHFY